MKREDPRSLSLPVIRIHQPIGDFYIGIIKSKDLCDICWFDIRQILKERDLDTYMGIQRQLSQKRVSEIKQYVTTIDATFPTGIILAVDESCASLENLSTNNMQVDQEIAENDRFGILTLSNYLDPEDDQDQILYRQIAKVIDGQHRIEGLRDYKGGDFELNVIIFIGADIADQASIFSTVNLAQTKVNRSLVYDLFSLSKARSPEKTCHEIVVSLDNEDGSPFLHKIKRLGVATEGRFGETLSQATVVKSLLKYISRNPAHDRDLLKRGYSIEDTSSEESEKLIFRQLFIEKRDLDIANIVWNYFDAVKQRWPEAWEYTGRGLMLNRTNGFNGLMRFLRPAYLHFTAPGGVVSTDQFYGLFERIDLNDTDFNPENFKPGTSGETDLYRTFMRESSIEE